MKYLALLLVGALAFTACSKDELENAGMDGSTPAVKRKYDYISKIAMTTGPEFTSLYVDSFTYDNQMRLIGVKSYLPYGNPRVDMNGKAAFSKDEYKFEKQDYSYYSGLYLRWSSSLTLDHRGKASEYLFVVYTPYNTTTGKRFETISKYDSLKYNSEGHLTSCYCHLYNWKVSNIWENGNLVSFSHNFHDDPPGVTRYQFHYTNIPNRSYPDLNLYHLMFRPFQHSMCFYSDELGLRSSKMTSEFTDSYNGKINDRYKISYKLDKKGRVIELLRESEHDTAYKFLITYVDQ